MKNLGEKLRSLRMKSGKSQKEMSELLSVNRVAYTQYENNKRTPPPDMIKKLCEIFQVSSDFLLDIHIPSVAKKPFFSLSSDEEILLTSYRQLNATGKENARIMIAGLTTQEAYKNRIKGDAVI